MAHINLALFSRTLTSEVEDMLQGGLGELGHTSTSQMFTLDPRCLNIVTPAVLIPREALDQVPLNTVFYNIEDLEHQPADKQRVVLEVVERGFVVWDYARKNLGWFAAHGHSNRVRHVPFGYAKSIDRVPRLPWESRTIDVLFYGKLTQRRVDAIAALTRTSLTVGVFSHIYGALRDDLMARSKMVLDVPAVDSFVAENPRVTFCASNRKVCVAERPAYPLAPEWEEAVTLTPYPSLVEVCVAMAADRDRLMSQEQRAYDAIRTLPISASLATALAALPSGSLS
jgi:hypothetical protein